MTVKNWVKHSILGVSLLVLPLQSTVLFAEAPKDSDDAAARPGRSSVSGKPAAKATVKPVAKSAAAPAKPASAKSKAAAAPTARSAAKSQARAPRIAPLPQPSWADVAPLSSISATVGQVQIVHLPRPVGRIAIGDDSVLDFRLLNPREIYVLGKSIGQTNMLLWQQDGTVVSVNAETTLNLDAVRQVLDRALPRETGILLSASGASIVLAGEVSDAMSAQSAVALVEAYAANLNRYLLDRRKEQSASSGGSMQQLGEVQAGRNTASGSDYVKVVNLMKLRSAQQVMLQVRIAEVSKSVTEQLGLNSSGFGTGGVSWGIVSNGTSGVLAFGSGAGLGTKTVEGIAAPFSTIGNAHLGFNVNGKPFNFDLEAQRKNGLVKILAEPTIVAISGEEGSFLAGGKLLIPVSQSSGNGTAITLEEREYGVGLKFRPTVLDHGRINLRVAPEVSEISRSPLTYSAGGASPAILPAFSTTKVSTTVELREGQSLVIGGLLKNNAATSVKAFPLLGEIPILGALFRSTDFASDKTELVVVVRPVLVAGTDQAPSLPTDTYKEPSRTDLLLGGKTEGTRESTSAPTATAPAEPARAAPNPAVPAAPQSELAPAAPPIGSRDQGAEPTVGNARAAKSSANFQAAFADTNAMNNVRFDLAQVPLAERK